jgi:hemoglobin
MKENSMIDQVTASLYARLGGYDAFAALNEALFIRLKGDPEVGRFWHHRSEDSIKREKQLALEYFTAHTGGPSQYIGRDLATTHRGMGITDKDWSLFLDHLKALLDQFNVGEPERGEVLAFIENTRSLIVC